MIHLGKPMHLRAFLTVGLLLGLVGDAFGQDTTIQAPGARSLQHTIASWIRPSIAMDEQAINRLIKRLATLPPLTPGRSGERLGYHSPLFESETDVLDVVVDLGKIVSIDRFALFSVSAVFQGQTVPRYGFPKKYVVETAMTSDFTDATLLLHSESLPPMVRPKFPIQASFQSRSARYLRLRVLKHWRRADSRFLTAIGEIMVLSGGRNVAIGAKVRASEFTTMPDWSRENLVDGQTDMGLPVDSQTSVTNGFLSSMQTQAASDAWIQVTLPEPASVQEVRVIPAKPVGAPTRRGYGFPRRFRILTSLTPEFEAPVVVVDQTGSRFPDPGENSVVFRTEGANAQFIRLEVKSLGRTSQGQFSIALSELQVIGEGRNLSRDGRVTFSDGLAASEPSDSWAPEFLIDGNSSQNRLVSVERWLANFEERENSEREIGRIQARISRSVAVTSNAIFGLGAISIFSFITLAVAIPVRRKKAFAKQGDELRARIARDLHDDIGSRLGGMRLISESMSASDDLPDTLREDAELLRRASQEATDSMRDIVWLLDNRQSSRSQLINHMRQMPAALLPGLGCDFIDEPAPAQRLDVGFRRQVIFAFKEALGNVAKHAQASRVRCLISGDEKWFRFEVRDDGKGFLSDSVNEGYGMENLRKRAESLGGDVCIASVEGQGTTVAFKVPILFQKNS